MEMFDMGLIKREPLEEFNNDSTYFDQIMPYSNDVFDQPIDWLCHLNDDRTPLSSSSTHPMVDQFNAISDYSNMVLNSANRDQTLNRINEFDHRLEGGNHDLECEMKSFYSTSHHTAMSYNSHSNYNIATTDLMNTCNTGTTEKELLQRHELAAVPVKLEELEDTIRMSAGESDQERDESESGYDSGGHSPNSDTPGTPPQCLILGQIDQERNTYNNMVDMKQSNSQPKTRQPFFLSEEEKRTLITEGLPIPSGYPLTKSEERALKKVRRKIKNKISAQESRRKKKEYMETLEKRVELCTNENLDLRKRLESMETNNRNLINQLKKMQALVSSRVSRPVTTSTTQTTINDV